MSMALFFHKVTRFEQVPDGATVAIANNPVNGGRSLQLLAEAVLLKDISIFHSPEEKAYIKRRFGDAMAPIW